MGIRQLYPDLFARPDFQLNERLFGQRRRFRYRLTALKRSPKSLQPPHHHNKPINQNDVRWIHTRDRTYGAEGAKLF